MKTLITTLSLVLALGTIAAPAHAGWGSCKIKHMKQLVRAECKDSGTRCYVHLKGYSYGGNYRTKVDPDGKHIRGTTQNGTKFWCSKT